MNDTMKIVKLLEKSGLLLKVVRNEEKNEAKKQKAGFLGNFLAL